MTAASEVENKSQSEKGTISVQMENIFPIIKKWLYSDKEIFVRELVSNSVDAINKLRHLSMLGKAPKEDESNFKVEITLDKDVRTMTITDNGLGMTADEIKQYINEVAFSGARDFMEKYQSGDEKKQVIGHFGLGFYSSFMVTNKVEIDTLSYQEGAEPVLWSCEGTPEFEITKGTRTERGTSIKLYLTEEEVEFVEQHRVQHLIRKYCDFLPYPIMINGEEANKRKPLWDRNPNEVSKEEYLEFYKYLYPFSQEPYFWIHLNVEVPFRLKGILYFPHLSHELDPSKGNIKLFCHNVYVSDHCEDFIPRFLITLQGALDVPDIPLNVSRSMLQNDPYVQKVSNYITKKAADKLKELYNKDRDNFIKSWNDIHAFVKVGMMEDDKFYEKVKDIVIFKSSTGDYSTLPEYQEKNKEKAENKVYYTSDEIGQSSYLELFKSQGIDVLTMNTVIDTHFMQFLEFKNQEIKFARIDSDISEQLVDKSDEAQIVDPKTNKTSDETLVDIFKNNLSINKLEVKVERLKSEEMPALLLLPESARRMQEMARFMQVQKGEFEEMMIEDHTLIVNSNSPIVQNLKKLHDGIHDEEHIKLVCEHIYDLSMLAHRPLRAEKLEGFVSRANKVLELMTSK